MNINSIQGIRNYLKDYSGFSKKTIDNVIKALGFPLHGLDFFIELVIELEKCAKHNASIGLTNFINPNESISVYQENRKDIVTYLEKRAEDFGTDIFSLVQDFAVSCSTTKPTVRTIGEALWGSIKI